MSLSIVNFDAYDFTTPFLKQPLISLKNFLIPLGREPRKLKKKEYLRPFPKGGSVEVGNFIENLLKGVTTVTQKKINPDSQMFSVGIKGDQ